MTKIEELAVSIAELAEETKILKYEMAYLRELVHEMAKEVKSSEEKDVKK